MPPPGRAEKIGRFSPNPPPMLKEISIHIAAVHEIYRRLKPGWVLIHPPNSELRDSGRAVSKQIAMGLKPGAPDLIVFSPQGNAFFVEFKSPRGSLSAAQRDFQRWAEGAGLPYYMARSVAQAVEIFESRDALHVPRA
jgi:VRR-NUC domain